MTGAGKQKPAAAEEGTIPARTAARVAAVQALYQMDLAGTDLNDGLAEFLPTGLDALSSTLWEIVNDPGTWTAEQRADAAILAVDQFRAALLERVAGTIVKQHGRGPSARNATPSPTRKAAGRGVFSGVL